MVVANSSLQVRPFVVKRCMLISVKEVLNRVEAVEGVGVSGWVRTRRDSKEFSFLEVKGSD